MWEGVGDGTELQYIDPHSYGHQRCVFLVLLMLSAECWLSLAHLVTNGSLCWVLAFSSTSCHQRVSKILGAPRASSVGCGFPYHILSATSLDPNSSGALRAPSTWRGFPYHTSSPTQTVWLLVLTELYNSSRPLNRPLNLWNGIFDRHKGEITVMQLRGHSLPVY